MKEEKHDGRKAIAGRGKGGRGKLRRNRKRGKGGKEGGREGSVWWPEGCRVKEGTSVWRERLKWRRLQEGVK